MGWMHRTWNVLRPERLSRDLDRELSAHIAECADELMAGGLTEAEAAREARRRFGNPGRQKERTRDADVFGWLESIVGDVRYAMRSLVSAPVFALVAIFSLGLGIGANTAIFSLINAVMLRSLPVSAPEELVQVTMGESDGSWFTNPIWEELRDRQEAFSGVFSYARTEFNLADGGEARRTNGYWVSGGFFSTLGLRPRMGRLLTTADDVRGCAAIAVVSASFWDGELGGRPALEGTGILLNGTRFDVVGVVDPSFTGVDVGQAVHIYAPLCTRELVDGPGTLDARSNWYLRIIGRPRAGIASEQVRARLAALAPAVFGATIPPDFDAQTQNEYASNTLSIEPAEHGLSSVREQYGAALEVLLGVVGVVLLIACANVANLLLARATTRRHELAIRLAIGAGRMRVVRQMVTESLVLALFGAALGVFVARWGSSGLVRLLDGQEGTVWLDLSLDARILAFTSAVAVVCGLLFGLVPAWRATRVAPQSAMQSGGRAIAQGSARFTVGKALVIGQVSLSFALIVAAGLLLGTFRNVVTVDSGFVAEGVLLVRTDLHRTGLVEKGRALAKQAILARLRATPGVRSASASHLTPVSGHAWNGRILVEGYTPQSMPDALVFYNAVSDDFLKTMGTRLVAGRDFQRIDRLGAPRVALINQTMAHKFFGTASPIGRVFTEDGPGGAGPAHTIIGIVEDTKYSTLREDPLPIAYLPIAQEGWTGREVNYAIRTDADPAALEAAVSREVGAIHPAITIVFTPFDRQVASSLSRERLLAMLAGFFGALALTLSMIGLYGTMSYAVARRRVEIGVRLALGAAPGSIVQMVVREAGWLIVIGLVLGVGVAVAGTRSLEAFLFGVTPTDPRTIAVCGAFLVLAALAAAALPAWRASRSDPLTALRES